MTDIVHVNMECKIIYSTSGVLICKDDLEFSNLLLKEKERIKNRDYILDRFEHWEVEDIRSLKNLLVSRSKNSSERNLVLRYMEHINKENV